MTFKVRCFAGVRHSVDCCRVARRRQPANIDGVRVVRNGLVSAIEFSEDSTKLPAGAGRTIVRIAQLQKATKGELTIIGRGDTRDEGLARARLVKLVPINLGVLGGKIRMKTTSSNKDQVEVYIAGGRAPERRER